MNTQKTTKLNRLISNWQRGAVYTQSYLTQLGYYPDLVKSYRRNGWLEPVGAGAYKLPNDQVDWLGGLYAIQQQLQLPVHAGGRTALELKGYAHYGRLSKEKCFLYGNSGSHLPKWFSQHDWGVELYFRATNLFPPDILKSYSEYSHKELSIRISTPERAAMEMLYYVPALQGFDEAYRIMESLMSLRPQLVQNLLETCRQIKVKRLFLYMAERLQMPWLEELEVDRINLGKGKRLIATDGILDKKYLITVPRENTG